MILATEIPTSATVEFTLHLPFGLIGLPKLTHFSVSIAEESRPFMYMKSLGDERVNFVVIDPSGLIPDYEIKLSDEDANALQIETADDATVLNIATVHSLQPQFVTLNLVGPIVVNRHSGLGKQVIVMNGTRFSPMYPLIDQRATKSAA